MSHHITDTSGLLVHRCTNYVKALGVKVLLIIVWIATSTNEVGFHPGPPSPAKGRYCQENFFPPKNFYPSTKHFSKNIKKYCPTLKIFVPLV